MGTLPAPSVRRTPALVRTAGFVFGAGVVLWVLHLAVVLVLLARESTWYPAIFSLGGEMTSWVGPGWTVETYYCFGTIADCANYDSSPELHFYAPFLGICAVVWALVALGIGWLRQRTKR